MYKTLIGLFSLTIACLGQQNILDFGAVPFKDDPDTIVQNEKALLATIDAAMTGQTALDRTVLVPEGNNFFFKNQNLQYMKDITFQIDGVITASQQFDMWTPCSKAIAEKYHCNLLLIQNSQNVKIQGKGTVDGMGFKWWIREYRQLNGQRPNLLSVRTTENLEVEGVRFINAPFYHIETHDTVGQYFHDFEIYVSSWKQKPLLMEDQYTWDIGYHIPIYALNTDGIDPRGRDIVIRRVNITNYDDAVAAKSSSMNDTLATCTENMLVEDCHVTFSVGLTIGSVFPDPYRQCIRNVTFRNNTMNYPIKSIYLKNDDVVDPYGTENPYPYGSGEISNINYEDIKIHFPLWWGIYMGPQQQKQPGGAGHGCMLYPFGECEVPRWVDFRNITLKNVESHGGLLPPGVLLFNETNPGTGIQFDNVQIDGWWKWFGMGFKTHNTHGVSINSSPDPFAKESDEMFAMGQISHMVLGAIVVHIESLFEGWLENSMVQYALDLAML